jgi:hypothetical protein
LIQIKQARKTLTQIAQKTDLATEFHRKKDALLADIVRKSMTARTFSL